MPVPHFDVTNGMESGQKSPSFVFIFSPHLYQISLKSILKSAIYVNFSLLGTIWHHREREIRSKITKTCFNIFWTLLSSFIEIDSKISDLCQIFNFGGILILHYDVIEGVELSQKSPKLVFKFPQHLCRVSLKSIQKSAIYPDFSRLGAFWPSIMTS